MGSQRTLPPQVCPECSAKLEPIYEDPHQKTEIVSLHCPNREHCPPQITGILNHWCRNVKIYDLSSKRLRQFVDASLVRSIDDLYSLKVQELENLEGLREKMAHKHHQSMNLPKNFP